jgi:hypothetical protein
MILNQITTLKKLLHHAIMTKVETSQNLEEI